MYKARFAGIVARPVNPLRDIIQQSLADGSVEELMRVAVRS
ncbi:hypothetical protein ACVXHA_09795 [Escherichia coli]